MYRNNISITPGPESLNRSSRNFYTFEETIGDHAYVSPSPYPHGHHDLRHSTGSVTPQSNRLVGSESADLTTKVDQMMTMLSKTQQLVVSQQATTTRLEETVAKLTQDVTDLKSVATAEDASGAKGSQKPKNRKIPKELSNAVKNIHLSMDEDNRFVGSEMFSSESNQNVASYLCSEIKAEFGTKYDGKTVKRAVYRYFESRRRIYNDSLPHRKEAVTMNRKKAQKKACQSRLYERRKKVLKSTKEKKKFQQIDYKYMTEESVSEDDDDVIRTHKLQWRSDKLNEFMEVLDTRLKEDSRTPGGFSLKSRVESLASTSSPPADAPGWAIRSDSTATAEASGSTVLLAGVGVAADHEPSTSGTSGTHTTETPSRAPVQLGNCKKKLTTECVHDALSDSGSSAIDFSDTESESD